MQEARNTLRASFFAKIKTLYTIAPCSPFMLIFAGSRPIIAAVFFRRLHLLFKYHFVHGLIRSIS
jgi:hypothetical protein